MVVEKVHGLQATSMSLNDRFTILAAAPAPAVMRQRRRPSVGSYFNQNLNFKNRNLMELIARRLEMQANRQAVKQRLGMLRRFGSESSLPGLRRANSFGNLSQSSVKNRVSWKQSNGNLSRAASFASLQAVRRGRWRRGGPQRLLRGRFRGGHQMALRMSRVPARGRRGRPRSLSQPPARAGPARGRARGRGQARGAARGMARGRGGVLRSQSQKPVLSKEELDLQLDQYMAGTRAALDRELDSYMNNAMDLE